MHVSHPFVCASAFCCCIFRILHIPEEFRRLFQLISLALFAFLSVYYVVVLFLSILISVLLCLAFFVHSKFFSRWQCVSEISEALLLARRKVFDVCIAVASIHRWQKGCEFYFLSLQFDRSWFFFFSLACFNYASIFDWRVLCIRVVASKTSFSIE